MCHACSVGTENDAGDDASGNDTACEPIVCNKSQFVKNNACHTCPRGTTNPAGDKATGGNTTCVAKKCARDQKVLNNECRGCPPGKSNAAGDNATGKDSLCDTTYCKKNQRVVDNACVSCPDGYVNAAKDDASQRNTFCNKTCAAYSCPSGFGRINLESMVVSSGNCCMKQSSWRRWQTGRYCSSMVDLTSTMKGIDGGVIDAAMCGRMAALRSGDCSSNWIHIRHRKPFKHCYCLRKGSDCRTYVNWRTNSAYTIWTSR